MAASRLLTRLYTMSGSGYESGENDDEVESLPSNNGVSKPKRWVWSETDAYFVNLLIRTCIEIHESGQTLSLPHIHAKVIEIWHRRCVYYCYYSYLYITYYYAQIPQRHVASQAARSSASLRTLEAYRIRRQGGVRRVHSAAFNVGKAYCQPSFWRNEAKVP